jgi:hypothetical protein
MSPSYTSVKPPTCDRNEQKQYVNLFCMVKENSAFQAEKIRRERNRCKDQENK